MDQVIFTLNNVEDLFSNGHGFKRIRLYNPIDKWRKYKLLNTVSFKLSNGEIITIKSGFEWDLSSVPKFLWGILSPDGDFEGGAIIHDYLYETKLFSRSFADKEMLIWSMKLNGTKSKISFKHMDNYARYIGVRLFGWLRYK